MKKHLLYALPVLFCTFSFCVVAFAQATDSERLSKVGGFKLPDDAYGYWSIDSHRNENVRFTDFVNYSARCALWVGGRTAENKVSVTAGTGNQMTHQPEWLPDVASTVVNEETAFQQVEKTVTLHYSDAEAFDDHVPLGLQVEQNAYGFLNAAFAVVTFDISLSSEAKPLTDVYVGFFVDVDAPTGENTKRSQANDKVGFADKGTAPYIYDTAIQGTEIPLLGAAILGVKDPVVSWWPAERDPIGDQQQYDFLRGQAEVENPSEADDFRFLLSYGPLTLAPGETIHFPVALVQSPQVDDFEDNLKDAEEFFAQELGGATLQKQLPAVSLSAGSPGVVPSSFQLYQNFPNPFNPETQISFDLPQAGRVELRIYNSLGQLVRTLTARDYAAGRHTVTWDARDDAGQGLASGLYIYRIKAGDFQAQRKLVLLK